MEWNHLPTQVEGLDINQLADGYVVYETARDRVHYLNHTAVLVLEMCNGNVKAEEIPGLLKTTYDLAEPPIAEVAECLARLSDEGLIR